MSYAKHNYQSGDVLTANDLNEMDDQIEENERNLQDLVVEDFDGLILNIQRGY